jgi:hypothetical protein
MKNIIVSVMTCMLLFSLVYTNPADAGDPKHDYVGTWLRIEKYANNSPLPVKETAVLVLTKTTFSSDSKGVPGAECKNSGDLAVSSNKMVMTIKASTCPSIINVGSVVTTTFSLSPDKKLLTMINTEWGYTYKEVLKRQ